MNNKAKEFLANCGATMTITYLDCEVNQNWGESSYRNTYRATIKTPMGTMWVKFWDSINNTQNGCMPEEYDILACLQKYEVGSLEDFLCEFGYEPSDGRKIYKAVCREYEKVCRCFTVEQIEQLQEIQ